MSRINGYEYKKLDTHNLGDVITLKVKGQYGIEVSLRIKMNTPLKKLLNTYCFRRSVRPNYVTFLFLGRLFGREQTPYELDMEEGDCIRAIFHQNEEQRVCFDEQIAKDNAREEEYEAFVHNKVQKIIWRIVSKLIAENNSLKEEVTRLTEVKNDEEKDAIFLKIGRSMKNLMRENGAPRDELKKELTRLREEIKEDMKDEIPTLLDELEEDGDEDDEDLIADGRFVFELIEWAHKNEEFLRFTLSKL